MSQEREEKTALERDLKERTAARTRGARAGGGGRAAQSLVANGAAAGLAAAVIVGVSALLLTRMVSGETPVIALIAVAVLCVLWPAQPVLRFAW